MIISALCDPATAAMLRFDWLVTELQPISDYGREHFQGLRPFSAGREADARRHAERVAAIASSSASERLESIREALRQLPDVRSAIARARLGETLVDADFLTILRFCEGAKQLATLVDSTIAAEPISVCTKLLEALTPGKSGEFAFYLSDQFSEALTHRRRDSMQSEARFEERRSKLAQRIAKVIGRSTTATDEFIVMRDELRGELPAGVHVIREAPTYFLCELELDQPALEALQERDRSAAAVAAAEESVRRDLSALIADCADTLDSSAANAAQVDVAVAAARYAQRYNCIAPVFLKDATLQFTEARFLPLEHDLALKNRRYVPITMSLERSNVLTGPNMGGKSAALRTAGFIALCAAFGLPVPARSATVGLFDGIRWLGIDGNSKHDEEQLLSSFAQEVVRLREMLDEQRRALWLIDEFARTTGPEEAQALLVALLHRLQERDGCSLVATHLILHDAGDGIAQFSVGALRQAQGDSADDGAPPSFAGTEEALRALAQRTDYGIRRVREAPQSVSDAIELAGWLGLDQELVESAKEILSRCNR